MLCAEEFLHWLVEHFSLEMDIRSAYLHHLQNDRWRLKLRPVSDPRVERAHSVDIHVGARVRTRRKALGVSQIRLAQELGLTFQQVQKYERGSNRVSASKLFEIGVALQVPITYFFEGYAAEGTAPDFHGPEREVREFLSSSEAVDLGSAYLQIPNETQRNRMLDLMRALANNPE